MAFSGLVYEDNAGCHLSRSLQLVPTICAGAKLASSLARWTGWPVKQEALGSPLRSGACSRTGQSTARGWASGSWTTSTSSWTSWTCREALATRQTPVLIPESPRVRSILHLREWMTSTILWTFPRTSWIDMLQWRNGARLHMLPLQQTPAKKFAAALWLFYQAGHPAKCGNPPVAAGKAALREGLPSQMVLTQPNARMLSF